MKLTERVSDYFSPAEVQAFFVGVRGHGGKRRLVNPSTPLQREYVIAITTKELVVLRLKRPGVFRASITDTAYSIPVGDTNVAWQNGEFIVGGVAYQPITFHSYDAEHVAELVAGKSVA